MKARRRALVIIGAALLSLWSVYASPPDDLRKHVQFLSASELEGRLTGSPGERAAADYIVRELERIGARPLPGRKDLVLPFEFTAGTEDAGSTIALMPQGGERAEWKGQELVRALSFSDRATVSGPVVFAGYGLTVPQGQEPAYDSYAGIDVRDKIVLVLRYSPEIAEDETRTALARYAGLRYKALRARELGARALLVITGPRSPNAGKTIPMSFDAAISGSGIAAASIGEEVTRALFRRVEGKSLEEVQAALDTGNPHVAGFDLPGIEVTVDVKVEREKRTGRNVVGYLGETTEGSASKNALPVLVLGAHYDHLGRGDHGNSLARKEEAGQVHHGADDNASGVAAVLAAGARLAALPRPRPIVLAFWSGEELGLLGSSQFLRDADVPRDRIAAYLNFDMVGRMRDERLFLQGVGSSSVWPELIEQSNVAAKLDVRTQDDPYLPTDSSSFYQAGVPSLSFFTGGHEDYHRPTDLPRSIQYDGLNRIVDFAVAITSRLGRLGAPPDFVHVVAPAKSGGDRDSVRAFTGTIPDYTTEVKGLRLSGVIGGGPADKAGLREGDVIVQFAGREITNIYDYTYALDAVKIGQPVALAVLREGRRIEVTITPTARP